MESYWEAYLNLFIPSYVVDLKNITWIDPVITPFWFEHIKSETVERELLRISRIRGPMLIVAVVYMLTVWLGPKLMKNRPAFELKGPLALWNWSLALLSTAAMLRSYPEFYHHFANRGFHETFCVLQCGSEMVMFWSYVMLWSKVVDLGDTLFLILRKKPVIFLHWFHHATVVYCVFHIAPYAEPVAIATYINFFIHSIMYSYYALRAMDVKTPKNISKLITYLQLAQFYIVLCVNVYTIIMWANGSCNRRWDSVLIFVIIGIAYIVLFSQFFRRAYMSKPKPKIQESIPVDKKME